MNVITSRFAINVMKIIPTWVDAELMDKEIRSCDNKDVGHVKAGDNSFLGSVKGVKSYRIPREAIASFDGDKVYLRSTEAEVLAGIYPFIQGEDDCNCECHEEEKSTPNVTTTKAI
ncbi:MAG: hypothetical protein ACHQ1H_10530 [Nitrososphaerales archaeon]